MISRTSHIRLLASCSVILISASASHSQTSPRIEREQQFLRGRTLPDHKAAALLRRAYRQKLALHAKNPQPSNGSSTWTSLGPAPLASDASGIGLQDYNWVSGRATSVAVDASDLTANTVYLGAAYGGLWKSTNAAAQSPANVIWTPLTDTQPTLAIGAIAVEPGGTGVILAGTGEANSSSDSYYGLGILRTVDAGQNWILIPSDSSGTHPFAGLAFSKLAFNTTNPTIAVAATAGASEGILEGEVTSPNANLGLYGSSDAGNSWTYATINDGNLTIDPSSATSVVYNAVAGLFFAAVRYHGFYSSPNGLNWTRLAVQPGSGLYPSACPSNPHSTACPIYRGEIAVVPGRNEMYVWYVNANNIDQGIWQTINGGLSWLAIDETGINNCGDVTGCGSEDGTYNLTLAAVPDGGATDLYAGAVNLFKCQITSSEPTCSGTGQNTFLNLTHAYGCSGIARVHPAQHAIAFELTNANTQDVMYFANDGGLYRSLNAYTGLTTGTCGGQNQFDSLNQTLGSITQLVSFTQSPSDFNTVLAGAGANGSPATQSALSDTPWLNVNAGDGGNSQINPADPTEWFVSNPPDFTSGANIFRCENGINCHTQDFQDDQVVSSATVGGDTGAYYPSFILDPQNSNGLIVGTCRIWRGSSNGSNFTLLSPNFETGGFGVCTGSETNLVRAIAAGGPLDQNNLSTVMYAATDGFGPLVPTIPTGGHIWVSTNVDGGPNTWIDETQDINPNSFPISSIAIDTSDPTGLTAYVTIMGFGVSHIWQTTNGGVTWNDFTANLPDAPANAVLVDPATNARPGMVYVGTDVGVYSSFTSSPSWTELGPAPNSGNSGFLPNVAVTALSLSVVQSAEVLRASTYGRGLWQFPVTPTFIPSIANTPQTVFPGQLPAQFNGTVLFYGYTNSVNLNCQQPLPPNTTCSVQPASVSPAFPSFSITTNAPTGTSAFAIKGVGTDPNQLTATAPFTLNVVDFNLTAPSPNQITVPPNDTSAPIKFQVTASGPFEQTVNLSCTGLPTGAACIFQPSAANPTSSKPVNVTLNITTAGDTPPGTYPVTISGSVTNGPTRSQNLSLTVIADYTINISNPSLQTLESTTVNYNGTLTSLNGYGNSVNLSCGTGAPPTCSAAPASVIPDMNGAPFTVTVGSPTCGQYKFSILAKGTDPNNTSHSFPVAFTSTSLVTPTFVLAVNNPALTANLGASAIFNGTLFATACYSYPVQLSCGSNAPPSCAASPKALVPTTAGAPFTVTVSSDTAQTFNFNISGLGTDPKSILSQQLVSFTAESGSDPNSLFTLSNDSGSESVAAGQTATFDLVVAATHGKLADPVTFSISGCPSSATCTFSPAQVSAGIASANVQLQIQTTAASAHKHGPLPAQKPLLYTVWLLLPGLVLSARRRVILFLSSMGLAALLCSTLSCGGGLQGGSEVLPSPGTTPNTYLIIVTAAMNAAPGSPTQTVGLTLTVN